VFEGDNYAWNPDIVTQFITVLMQKKQYMRAVKAKLTYIKHMKKETASADHQVRRSFLEIICIQIINEDYKRMEETMAQFIEDCGSSVYQQDEYLIAN